MLLCCSVTFCNGKLTCLFSESPKPSALVQMVTVSTSVLPVKCRKLHCLLKSGINNIERNNVVRNNGVRSNVLRSNVLRSNVVRNNVVRSNVFTIEKECIEK